MDIKWEGTVLSLNKTCKRERDRESDQGFASASAAWVKTLAECLPVYVWAVLSPLCIRAQTCKMGRTTGGFKETIRGKRLEQGVQSSQLLLVKSKGKKLPKVC